MVTYGRRENASFSFAFGNGGRSMAENDADLEHIMERLRKEHPKQGPDRKPGESLEHWADRYMEYVRKKYDLK